MQYKIDKQPIFHGQQQGNLTMRIHYLQHVPFENLGLIEQWVSHRGHSLSSTLLFHDDHTLPDLQNIDMLIVLGGPMSVHDEAQHPWLKHEKAFIKAAIQANKRVLGVCLGAQLIAEVLDAQVTQGAEKEIGWFPIAFSDDIVGHPLLSGFNLSMVVFHWHGEQFSLPKGAMSLGRSAVCPHQGFLFQDKVLALQFHMEMDEACIEKITEACSDELVEGPFIQSKEAMLEKASQYPLDSYLFRLLDNWVQLSN